MKKIIPFKKDIIFKTNVSEITSISLEHTLDIASNNDIGGNFIVSGEYKMTDTSTNVESFSYNLPFHISMDERYILDNIKIDIDDFYYEIINDNVLSINIEVLIDKLEEKIIEEVREEKEIIEKEPIEEVSEIEKIDLDNNELEENINETNILEKEKEEEDKNMSKERCIEPENTVDGRTSLFDNMDSSTETYKSYKVYIIREGDNLESIIEKYSVSKEILEEYNDLKELKIGDKIIIPS